VVVVNFGGGLPVAGAEDAPGVLDKPALVGDWRGEEEGVEGGAVEALPGVRAGRDREQRRPAGPGLQPRQGGGPLFSAHATLEHDRVMARLAQHSGECLQVGGLAGQHEAVPALGEGDADVGGDLPVAVLVGDQVLRRHRPRGRRGAHPLPGRSVHVLSHRHG
jgi:hypothetical protein